MRALVITAFILTLTLSSAIVYFALSSDSLDGEPYALIVINPPAVAKIEQRVIIKPAPKHESRIDTSGPSPSEPAERVAKTNTNIPEPEPATSSVTPKLTPASTDEQTNNAQPEIAVETDEQVEATAGTISRPTETVQPIAETGAPENDPFFSAEPGIGLGVGNLGPLDSTPSAN